MQKLIVFIMAVISSFQVPSEPHVGEEKAVRQVIQAYLHGGDVNDPEEIRPVLAEGFRVVFHDTGKGAVQHIDQGTYLTLIGNKAFGGDPRQVEFLSIDIHQGRNAIAKVKATGSKAIFYNYFSLVKPGDQWLIVEDLATMEVKG